MPPLETRTDFPRETPVVPQDPCQHWRGILRFRHRLRTRSQTPASTGEESREAIEQLAWRLAFPQDTGEGPLGPRRNSRAPATLEKIQEVLPSRRDEAHFRSGVSRLITPNLWNFQRSFTPLLQLKKFPDTPVSTPEEARGSRPHPEELRFRLQAKDEGSFPASSG